MRNRLNVMTLLFLFGCAILFYAMQDSFSSSFLLYSIGFMVIYSLLLWLLPMREVESEREIVQSHYISGDEVVVTVKLRLRSILPIAWLVASDHRRHAGRTHVSSHRKLLFPWFRAAFVYQYRIPSVERGIYEFYELELVAGDIFGFVVKTRRYPMLSRIIVYPLPHKMEVENVRNQSFTGSLLLSHNLLAHESTVSRVRDYTHGDPINRIHWKTTARTQSLKTIELESIAERDKVVVLDACAASYIGPTGRAPFETCIQLAAGLLQSAGEHQCAAGFICSDAQQSRLNVSRRSELFAEFELLAGLDPDGSLPLSSILMREEALLSKNTALICIITHLDERLCQCIEKLGLNGRMLHIVYVHTAPVVANEQRQWIYLLEHLGCDFVTISCHQSKERNEQRGAADVSA